MTQTALQLVHTCGDLDSLHFEAAPLPPVGPDAVRISVHTAGLNFRDVLLVYVGFAPLPLPPGCEVSGTVEEVGSQVRDFKPGDEVAAYSLGQLGSQVVVPARDVVLKPSNLSLEEAGCFPISYGTAYLALNRFGQLRRGERVLIHSAAGGVGIAALQLARSAGAEIFATAGNDEKRAWLAAQGVPHVYDSRSLEFAEQIRADTSGEGVDVVLNSLPGESARQSLRLLRWGGRFLEIGKKDFVEDSPLPLGPFLNALTYSAVDIAEMVRRDRGASSALREVRELLQRGELEVKPLKTFSMSEIAQAFRYMGSGRHIGRIGITFR
jgi:NADPH:quinone reductase-like Zn-dependent oxidoreductase